MGQISRPTMINIANEKERDRDREMQSYYTIYIQYRMLYILPTYVNEVSRYLMKTREIIPETHANSSIIFQS